MEDIVICLIFLGGLTKYIMIILGEQKFVRLFEFVSEKSNQLKRSSVDETKIMQNYLNIGRVISIVSAIYFYASATISVILPTVIPPMLSRALPSRSFDRSLFTYLDYFVNEDEYYFYMLTHHVYTAIIVFISVVMTMDTTHIIYVQNVLGLYEVVEFRLNEAFVFVSNPRSKHLGSKYLEDYVHDRVLRAIKLHRETTELAQLIQSVYNGIFFICTTLFFSGISIFTVNLTLNLHNPIQFLRISAMWLSALFYLLYLYLPGQKLLDTNEQLYASIYACGWYEFPRKTQILLRFMMMRSIPCKLTAGLLILMSFESWSGILQTAWSYFTVILSLSE